MRDYFFGASPAVAATRTLCILATTIVLAGCGNSSGGGQAQAQAQQPPTPVHTVTARPHRVDVYAEYPGRVQGKQTAQVIGRVNGILQSKDYNEGSIVHKGDLLYKIDPKPYQATVDQRKATLASARARLANSTRILKRTRHLYKVNAVSQAERDQALSNYQSDAASVQQARANLESAQINLDYTSVTAPLTGVTSLREVDQGALVRANQTQLTTITQLDPVYVLFALPEDDAFARRKALAEMGKQTNDNATRQATVMLSDGSKFPYPGQVDFTQSTIDPQTGTVQLRALVKNPENALMPGRYVRVRIRIQTLPDAITVPDQAISSSGQQTQVLVARNGKASGATVTLGPSTDQGTVITKGLSAGDEVITSGLGTLKPGAAVKRLPGGKKTAGQNSSGSAGNDNAPNNG